jgi:hypothetical protein
MGLLLEKLGLKPTAAMTPGKGAVTPPTATKPDARPKSPEMTSLIARFQEVMGRIKGLEAGKVPGAAALKLATIAAGNLSTSPKGIVAANAALDKVVKQIADLKAKLDQAQAGKAEVGKDGAKEAVPQQHDGKKLADEARKRLKALEARGQKAIAANPRNPNAGWLAEVVANSEGRFASLEKHGTEPYIGNVQTHLDWLEDSVKRFEADAAEEGSTGGSSAKDGGGTAKDEAPRDGVVPDAGKLAERERKRLKALDARGRKALAADPGKERGDWLTEVVEDFAGRIDELESEGTRRQADDVKKQLDWLKENVVRFEADAKRKAAEESGKKPQVPDSPALKQAKVQYRQVMAEIRKLAAAKSPQAESLKEAAAAAGNLATSPKGIEDAMKALDAVMADVAKATAEAAKVKAEAVKVRADAAKAKRQAKKGEADAAKGEAEAADGTSDAGKADDGADAAKTDTGKTFDITVAGKKLSGVGRAEAMKALKPELRKLHAQLEGGWAYHVDQMNLPSEIPFQAWLTSGVDALKSFVKGQDAAKIPDLNIWDPARDMMNEVTKAERQGDVEAMAALLPKIAAAIPKARSQVSKYQDQMEGSAETGVEAGRFVEDTSASAIGAIAEKEGGKAGKIAAQSAAQGLFQGVEQLTEWMIGTRKEADPGAIAKKMGEEAIGAIFKELVAGQLKPLFKSAFGSYLDKSVSDAALKAMGLSRDAFMTAGQKYLAEFAAKQGAGMIKSAIAKLIGGKLPSSPGAMVDAVAAELMKGSSKQLIVDGIKEIAKAAVTAK